MSKGVQEYGVCIIFNLLIPLLPIFLEKYFTGSISSPSMMISAAIYSVAVGNASSYKLLFAISILIGMIFSACFGVAMIEGTKEILPKSSYTLAAVSIVAILTISLAEKYATYIVEKKKCWNFL